MTLTGAGNEGDNAVPDDPSLLPLMNGETGAIPNHSLALDGPAVGCDGQSVPGQSAVTTPSGSLSSVKRRISAHDPEHCRMIEHDRNIFNLIKSRQKEWEGRSYRKRRLRKYYKKQDHLIQSFELAFGELPTAENGNSTAKAVARAARLSFMANILLMVIKLAISIVTGSLSIVSSLMDSFVDLFSGSVIWYTNRAMKHRNIYNYPQGRTRLEPVSIVIISVVMSLCSFQMVILSVQSIVNTPKPVHIGIPSIISVVFTVLLKVVLYLYCRRIESPSIQALAVDHRNDVVSNTFALGFCMLSVYVWRYIDPIGAILLCFYIIFCWRKTGKEQIQCLTGHTAPSWFLQKITWIAFTHSADILKIDTVRAFHHGINYLVEVDVVLPEDMSLKLAHNVGEELQVKIEALDEVERCFVHLDYEYSHKPEDEHKTV